MNNKFCIWCGSAMEENGTVCPECAKNQPQKENQLVDWLVKHTKSKLQGDAESSLYEAIKNFLLSHLYGTVVSLALVAAVGVTVYANPTYVTKTTAEKFYSSEPQHTENSAGEPSSPAVSASDSSEIQSVTANYLNNINYLGEKNADGETIHVENLEYWYPGYDGYREVGGADRRAGADGTINKKVLVYLPVFDAEYFVLESTGIMHNDGIPVAECYVEEFMSDKATGKDVLYRRTMYSLTKSEKGWCVFESRVEQLIEYNVINGNHIIDDWKTAANSQNPYLWELE